MRVFATIAIAIAVSTAAFLAIGTLEAASEPESQSPHASSDTMKSAVYNINDLRERREESARNYLPFLNTETLRTGLYVLAAGTVDNQQPHELDEVYYVVGGRSRFSAGTEDYEIGPGSVIFVAAHVSHRFYDIEEDLEVVVFFSEARPVGAGE